VAESAECIFLCVGDTGMAREAILGTDGLIHGARPGTVVADASTIAPSESRRIGQALKAQGVEFLDAPCIGSTPGAQSGNFTFMVGGDQSVFEKVKPYFEPMGRQFYYCGGPGMGLQAKLTQNLILSNILMAFNEGRDFDANFSVKWMHKDIGLMLESGKDLGVPLVLTGLTQQLFQTAIAAGHGNEDISSTINILEDLVGIEAKFQ
jgi:3-hydroxyisobutyrate dehydrogenase/2-hydroxy-3-oxopropionate reductase